ncbi:MAG: sigma-54 dependent transcriptional regulator [Planctomycetota bacterium]
MTPMDIALQYTRSFVENLLRAYSAGVLLESALRQGNLKFPVPVIPDLAQHEPPAALSAIVGRSPAMYALSSLIRQVAPSNCSVLILGETGTGKELVARAIHSCSPRAAAAFVPVNAGALDEQLFASEVFGHKKGAFTGADRDKTGLLELAQLGTFFLDEVGETALGHQVKFLRALEERKIRRLGCTIDRAVDIRLLAATNREPEELIRERKLRPDFYHRLKVVTIRLVPLRQRREDIALLVAHFLRIAPGRWIPAEAAVPLITPRAVARLEAHDWPGNVRELEHLLESAVALCTGPIDENFLNAALGPEPRITSTTPVSHRKRLADIERGILIEHLNACGYCVEHAAKRGGLALTTFYAKCKRFGIGLRTSGA